MSIRDLVLIDTCIWVPYFNRPQSHQRRAVDQLLDEDRAALIGPVLAEILCGFRRDSQADWVASSLEGLNYFDLAWEDWRSAARLSRKMAARGRTLPLGDLALATVALRLDCSIYTIDPHFDGIPKLRRFEPE